MTEPDRYRLPRDVMPVRYDLTLEPDLETATFRGDVVINVLIAPGASASGLSASNSSASGDGSAQAATISSITLNAAEIKITSATITQSGQTHLATVNLDEETERATLQLIDPDSSASARSGSSASARSGSSASARSGSSASVSSGSSASVSSGSSASVSSGPAQIRCAFTGILNDKLRGFYRSTYTTKDGDERTIATTQFESTNARRAFPCFDEPDRKAVFGVTLIVPEHLTAVSCGELVESEVLPDGRRRDRFADTMVMSTYLLAFIVGELEATEPVDVGGVPLRIVHIPGKSHLTKYGLEVGAFALGWLVDYYGIAYPGTKLDLVAVPDFAFGAMENMGCVTFRETLLLADPDTCTLAELTRIVDVVAHEIAHMWFGNLVTMDWWNGIWLKEAFATFMQMATTHAFRPQWHRWDEFSLERGAAFDVDSLNSTRPIEFDVVSPADAEGMYDLLTYEKGAAVVRMLEQFLGPAEFRAGVKHYLERFSYRNVSTGDLWEALESATDQPVRAAMETWIFQGGYPIVDVEADKDGIVLRQRRFEYGAVSAATTDAASAATADAGANAATADAVSTATAGSAVERPAARAPRGKLGELWHIPVTIRAQLHPASSKPIERRVLLTEPSVKIDLGGSCEWVTVNAGGHGFYRARYAPELLTQLTGRALEVLDPVERYALVDDTFASMLAGCATAAEFLELVTGLLSETDLHVWQRILGGLRNLHLVGNPARRDHLSQFIRDLSTTALGVLGLEPLVGESDLDRELRAALFTAAGTLGRDEFVREQAQRLFAQSTDGSASELVEPSLATAATNVTAAAGDIDDYDQMLDLYRNASTPQSEQNYLWALLQFAQPDLFDRTLALARDEVRTQNAPYLLAAAMAHAEHGKQAWEFVRHHWDSLCHRFPMNSISRMAGGVRALSTPELAAEVTTFFERNEVPQGELIVAQHIEKMWVNVSLRERLAAEPIQ